MFRVFPISSIDETFPKKIKRGATFESPPKTNSKTQTNGRGEKKRTNTKSIRNFKDFSYCVFLLYSWVPATTILYVSVLIRQTPHIHSFIYSSSGSFKNIHVVLTVFFLKKTISDFTSLATNNQHNDALSFPFAHEPHPKHCGVAWQLEAIWTNRQTDRNNNG